MERGENLLYQDAVKQIKQHLYRGDEIVVIDSLWREVKICSIRMRLNR